MKKALKWLAILLVTPILLFLLLTLLLYLPPVQNWAVDKVAAYASEQTGMDISVGHVSLRFPLDLTMDDVKVIKDNDSIPGLRDTIADVGKLYADIQLKPLLDKQVQIDALGFEQLRLNTDGLIPDLRVKGNVEKVDLKCHGVDLKESLANVDKALLDSAKLEICLSDTMPPDTTETENNWRIRVADLQLKRTQIGLRMPGDTMLVSGYIASADVKDGDIDLGQGKYKVAQLDCKIPRLQYDNKFQPAGNGLDANHIDISDMALKVDSISYSDGGLNLALRSCTFKEKSGIQVEELSAKVDLDSAAVHVQDLNLKTPDSQLKASADLDFNTFDDDHPGKLWADVDGYFGKQDLMRVMGDMPQEFMRKWPNQPLAVKGKATGNMQRMELRNFHVSLPTALQMSGDGYVANLNDPNRLKADMHLKGNTANLDFVTSALDPSVKEKIRIPQGIGIDGDFKVNGHQYGADFTATESGGKMKARVAFDADKMKYSATVDAEAFPLQHFVPNMGLSPLTAHVEADGQGTDFLSPSTQLRARANIGKFHYDQYDLDGMTAEALLSKGRLHADINSRNKLLDGRIAFDALMDTKRLQGTFACDLRNADFYSLRLFDKPLNASGCAHLDIDSDFKDYYKVVGTMDGMTVTYNNTLFKPDDLVLDVLTRRDTTYAKINSGDFHLDMNGRGGYKKMLSQVENFSNELTKQMKDKHFDQTLLRAKLPDANIWLKSGQENFFVNLIEEQGYSFANLTVDMKSSHVDGLNGYVAVDRLVADSIQLDSINFAIRTDSTGFKYNGRVFNGPDNPQYSFDAYVDGAILEQGADANIQLYDKDKKLAFDLGAIASIEPNGVMMHLTKDNPVLGYIPFTANKDNYIYLGDDKRLSANLKLKSDDGMLMQVSTNDNNHEALQDLTLTVGKLDLARIVAQLPYMPDVAGIADGDFHLLQTESNLSVSSSVHVKNLNYQKMPMGDLGTDFVYLPNEDGSHHVDGVLFNNGDEVGSLVGTYNPKGKGSIDAKLAMNRLPLSLVNGFIPNQIFGLRGFGEGNLSIKGPLSQPDVNGEVYLDDSYVFSIPYGVEMRIANDPVRIVGSNLLFENFEVLDQNNTPLNITGHFDFSDLDRMTLEMRMRARNFQIINAKENPKSEAFGKAFVNFFANMSGPVDALNMRGRLSVLGATDMTYVLRDSPLTTDNRLDELVRFVDFNDSTTQQVISRPPLNGFNMDLTLNVDEGARIKCDLNADHSNYIDLVGGGELRMRYNVVDNLRLTGRYVLNEAEMKYSLPVIPLKTFTIQEGSYIEFKGEPMNPTLHITATERRKASVEDEGGGTRSVDFTCGVVIRQTLENMGLEFIIDAPEDMAISTELAAMTSEERAKVAVTMLTTGMYLADGNTSGFTMNGALSSFLQSEINNITGNALRSLDLSVGVDNATDASGSMHTDYSFKFAKRFWNNRLRIILGGKVSTGADAQSTNQSFFTNVAFEYRLSATSNQYLKLFYDRDSYDWLEGEIGEYGGGFLWRRKLQHFKDIFRFKADTRQPLPTERRQNDGSPRSGNRDILSSDTVVIREIHPVDSVKE